MFRVNVALALFLLLAATPAISQTKPDFSGTWVLDAAVSSISPSPGVPLPPETMVVTQTKKDIRYERRSDGITESQAFLLEYPRTVIGKADRPMMAIQSDWKDASLVLTGYSDTGRKTRAQSNQPLPSLVPPREIPELNLMSMLVWSLSDGDRVLTVRGTALSFDLDANGDRIRQKTYTTRVYRKQ
jgi:hypothetical protein